MRAALARLKNLSRFCGVSAQAWPVVANSPGPRAFASAAARQKLSAPLPQSTSLRERSHTAAAQALDSWLSASLALRLYELCVFEVGEHWRSRLASSL